VGMSRSNAQFLVSHGGNLRPRLRAVAASFWLPILLFSLFSAVLLGVGAILFFLEEKSVRQTARQSLLVIARIKGDTIADWMRARRDDAVVLGSDLGLTVDIEQWMADGAPADSRGLRIRRRMERLYVYGDYAGIALTDDEGGGSP
jgi:hypothetical protein